MSDAHNPCEGVLTACNPATKEVDDYVNQLNEEYLKRAAKEGQDLKASLDHALETRKDMWKLFNTWQRATQLNETMKREELLARLDAAAEGGIGDMATARWMLLAEDIATADPDSFVAAGLGAIMHSGGSYVQGMLNLGAASGELSGKLETGQDTTLWDWVGAAGDVMTLLEPVAAATGGVRQTLKALRSTSAATKAERAVIQALALEKNLEIAIRAADPITATVTKVLTWFKVPAKPELIKAKSVFGVIIGRADDSWPKLYRSDLDIAWVRNAKTGELLDNKAVLGLVDELNTATKTGSFQHGSHFTGHPFGGGGPAASTKAYSGFGNPGSATVFDGLGTSTKSFEQVRELGMSLSLDRGFQSQALAGRWLPRPGISVPGSTRASRYSKARVKDFLNRKSLAAGPLGTAPMVLSNGLGKDDK